MKTALRSLALKFPPLGRIVAERDAHARLAADLQQQVQLLTEKLSALESAVVSPTVQQARINLLRATQEASDHLPDPGWRWHAYCIHARRQIALLRSPIEIIHSVQSPATSAGFEARMVGQQLIDHSALMEQTCRDLFPQFADALPSFAETPLSVPETVTVLNHRLVSSPLYNHIMHTLRCLSYFRPKCVMEIGGGYGAPGRLWMTNGVHRPHVYIDVDFPESLLYAEVYLRATLPDHDVVYLHRGEKPPEAKDHPVVILCPISNLDTVLDSPIDLIVNTGSLQEMSDGYVSFYMDAIERSRCDAFYSANYFAQPIQSLMESMNMAAPVMGPNWHTEFKAYYEDPTRGVAELLFLRKSKQEQVAALSDLRDRLNTPPRDGGEFLSLFDAARKVNDPDLLISSAAAAIAGMPFVPKEALFLARRVHPDALSGPALAMVILLERIAAEKRSESGIVDPTVAGIRNELMRADDAET